MDASSLNSLEKAQAAQTGVVQKNRSWREVTAENSDEYKEIQNVMNEGEGNVENMLKKLGGIKRTLTFADGETTKEVYIHVPDDEVSDGQVQAMFALTNAENIEISDAKTGYIVISDDEKGNKPEYELSKSSYSVSSAKDSVTVTVKKTAGTEQLSVANIVTSDGTAFDGINYEGVSESLIFPKGVKEKKVTIPIISSLSEDKYFFVGLGDEQGKTDESKLSTVTIKADKKSKASTGANTVVTSSGTEFTYGENYIDIDLSQWTLHSRYRNGGTYGSESGVRMDLRNVKKNLFKNWTDWGNGKQGWDVKVSNGRGDDVCLGSYSNNRTEHISNPVKVRNPDGSSFSTVYDLYVHEFNQTEKNKTHNDDEDSDEESSETRVAVKAEKPLLVVDDQVVHHEKPRGRRTEVQRRVGGCKMHLGDRGSCPVVVLDTVRIVGVANKTHGGTERPVRAPVRIRVVRKRPEHRE